MKHLIRFPHKGGEILVEVEEHELPSGTERVAKGIAVVETASKTFEEALDKIKPIATIVMSSLIDLGDALDEIQTEFGLKLDSKFGAVVASASIEANFKVALKWKKKARAG
jgi:hypothetical protein